MCVAGSSFLDPLGIGLLGKPNVPGTPRPPPPPPPPPSKTATRIRRSAAIQASQARARLGTAQLRVPIKSVNLPS